MGVCELAVCFRIMWLPVFLLLTRTRSLNRDATDASILTAILSYPSREEASVPR